MECAQTIGPAEPLKRTVAERSGLADLTSEELAGRAAAGSRDAFEELSARHRSAVLAFLARKTGNLSDAEDLAQETFARAFSALDRFDTKRQFKPWLYTIARRLAVSHFRKHSGMTAVEVDEATLRDDATPQTDRDHASAIWSRTREILGQKTYQMLWEKYVEGLSINEIARKHRKTKTGISVSLYRARVKLRKDATFREISKQ